MAAQNHRQPSAPCMKIQRINLWFCFFKAYFRTHIIFVNLVHLPKNNVWQHYKFETTTYGAYVYVHAYIYIYYKYIYICICYYLPSGEKYRISPAIHPSPTPRACAASKSSNAVRLAMGTSLFRSPLATDRRFSPTPPGWLGSDATDSGCSVVVKVWAQLVGVCSDGWFWLKTWPRSTPSVCKIPTHQTLSCPARRDHIIQRNFHLPTIEIQVTCDILVFGGVCAGKATIDPVLETFYSNNWW